MHCYVQIEQLKLEVANRIGTVKMRDLQTFQFNCVQFQTFQGPMDEYEKLVARLAQRRQSRFVGIELKQLI